MGKSTGRAAPKAPARDVYRSSGLVQGSNPCRGTIFSFFHEPTPQWKPKPALRPLNASTLNAAGGRIWRVLTYPHWYSNAPDKARRYMVRLVLGTIARRPVRSIG